MQLLLLLLLLPSVRVCALSCVRAACRWSLHRFQVLLFSLTEETRDCPIVPAPDGPYCLPYPWQRRRSRRRWRDKRKR
uniref:Putative secreted protein n=1 Tax=Anopheles darlingi TaxID=43151 RepID=A0A2M4D7L7_ANODA